MSEFTPQDCAYMARALRLAERGRYSAHPNPVVGCVLVKQGEIVGEGWHQVAGAAHAEINALQAAGDHARGATAYVTLEPCSHQGKTPPCSVALIEAGVEKVVAAMQDPNPAVAGSGLRLLQEAGIAVQCGLMQGSAEALNPGFLKRMRVKRPYVRLKLAASLDGATAMLNGESQWITGPEARADVQRLRARSGAVMTGIGTVLADDPSLTVRAPDIASHDKQPLRVVLDSKLRMPRAAGMLTLPGKTLICCAGDIDGKGLPGADTEVLSFGADGDGVDIDKVLQELAARDINEVLVEAGPTLAGVLLQNGFVDELVIYQAAQIMGSQTRNLMDTPSWISLADRKCLKVTDVRRIGDDTRITAVLS
jgi:diaminohydroxyphosphoribosylaminopyrimidine deaminase/5-amino-6-(5-phosphoribosylamino)uracil reductase